MKLKRAQLVPVLIASVAILIGCSILLFSRFPKRSTALKNPGLIEKLEYLTYDPRVRFATRFPDQHLATNLGCLFFDDNAIERVSNGEIGEDNYDWPWPRYIHGNLVKELAAQGAKAVGFDVTFQEPYRRDPIVRSESGESINSDQFFAEEIQKAGNVVLGMNADSPPAIVFMRANPGLGSVVTVAEGIMRRDRPFITEKFWNLKIRELVSPLRLDLSKPDTNIHPGTITFPILRPRDDEPTNYSVLLTKSGMLKLDENGELSADPTEPDRPSNEKPFSDRRIWSLGVVLAARDLGLDLDHPVMDPGKIVLRGPNGIERIIPLDPNGCFYIDWNLNLSRLLSMTSPTNPVYSGFVFHTLSQAAGRKKANASDLIAPFTNRVVVLGSIAEGNNITDMGATPLDEGKTPLMIKHVNIANSVLTGRFVRRCDWPVEILLILLLGPLTAYLTWNTRVAVGIAALIGIILLYIAIATWFYVQQRYWLTIVAPLLGGVVLPFSSLTAYRVLFEQDQKKHVKGVFSRIVSPDVVNELLGAEKISSLTGARRRMTVYFADVRGFTEFTDRAQAAAEEYVRARKLTPEQTEAYFDRQAADTLKTVNMYLSAIADMVKKHNGTLDKYIGDCVMAFWGAPVANDQHALCCVRAAIDAQRGMQALNDARAEENHSREQANAKRVVSGEELLPMLPLLNLGSGINTGTAIVGLMGSDAHILNYTVFGREVNLASRLEGYSGRGRIIISEATFFELRRDDATLAATCVKLDSVTPKGFREPIPIYEVPWRQPEAPTPGANA